MTKFRAMKCFPEVHQHILEGWTPLEVAKFIQDDRKEYTDATRGTVVNNVKEYRASLPPGELIARRMPAVFNDAAKKLKEGVDEVQELEWLTRFQKRRLKIDGTTERKINKLLPSMTQEVRAHVEVLRTLSSVKMDLGLNKRHLGSIEVDATVVAGVVDKYGTSSVAKVLQNSASRQKVMGIAEKFMALAQHVANPEVEDGEVIEAEPSFVPVPPPLSAPPYTGPDPLSLGPDLDPESDPEAHLDPDSIERTVKSPISADEADRDS